MVAVTSSLVVAGVALPAQASTLPAPAPSGPTASPTQPTPAATVSANASATAAATPTEPPPAPAAPGSTKSAAAQEPVVSPLPEIPAPGTDTPARATGAAEAAGFVPFGAIGAKWKELGGTTGPLGEPTSNEKCDPAGLCMEAFDSGEIYYTPSTGAHAVLFAAGRTGPRWKATGALASYGFPVTDEKCDQDGCYQRYSLGRDLTWSQAHGNQQVWGAIVDAVHRVYGGYATTGFPMSAEVCGLKDQGCAQEFDDFRIVWSASAGAFGVMRNGAIGVLYTENMAENGPLGFPTSKETCGLTRGGCKQLFEGGAIIWNPATGAKLSGGAIRGEWGGLGYESGSLGYPITNEVCGRPASGCQQEFQGGTIYWSPGTGAHAVGGGIKARFDQQGGLAAYLAYPLTGEVCNQPGGGCYQWFQGGVVFWSPATGAQPVRGALKGKYESMNWHRSYLGYPSAPESCEKSECVQSFQGGYLTWTTLATGDYRHTECTTLNDGRIKYPTGNAKHVMLTFAADYGQSYATVLYCKRVAGTYVTDWKTDGRVGASGFKPPGVPSGPTRNNFSPTGSFSITEAFGLGNPGTALPYRLLNPNSRWGGNPWTDTYNKYFESSSWVGWDENMWYFATGRSHDYRQGAVLNYNRPPDSEIVQDAGFAIFLHEHKVPTAGCIALDDWAVEDFLRNSASGDRVIMGVHRDIFK
jgi:uncharacterized protein with LGFP repeats